MGDRETPGSGKGAPAQWAKHLDHALSPDPGTREAEALAVSGVLVPILDTPLGPLVWLTRRSEELSSHPGQISYPGGRREPGETPQEAALREAREEIGLEREDVRVLGHLTDYPTHNDDLVCTYAGVVETPIELVAPLTPGEVNERILVTLDALIEGEGAAPEAVGDLAIDPGPALGEPYPVETYEGRAVAGPQGRETVHYWHLDDATTLWGISGEVTARLLGRAFDWSPPREAELVDHVRDLQP